ncbi:MAG: helix-turn-helix domain-containing protein [Chitinivibrionales bacterium]|nr:helix-turn-helix domain-containing protein [Chitinivibrionales bacterium]
MDLCMFPLSYRFERAGAEYRRLGFESGWRRFGNTLMTQVRGGGYLLQTESVGQFEIQDGMGFLVPVGLRTRVSVPRGETTTAVYSHFHCRVYEAQGLFTVLDRPVIFDHTTAERIGACNDALIAHQSAPRSVRASVEVSSLLAELVRIAVDHCPSLETAWRDPVRQRLLPLIRYVQEHLDQPMRRDDLARVAGLSVPHLHALFVRAFNTAPMELVRRERMQRARQLLHWSDLSVAEVAMQCGFEDQYYFSRAFKGAEGVPPSHYRRAVRASSS